MIKIISKLMNRNRFVDEKLRGGNLDIATCIAMKVDTKTIFFLPVRVAFLSHLKECLGKNTETNRNLRALW